MWPKKTGKILKKLSEYKHIGEYIFVGGSALSYYLKHRLSEDVDLFYEGDFLQRRAIGNVINRMESSGLKCRYVIQNPNQIDAIVNSVKVTFYASGENFLSKDSKILINNIRIASFDVLIYMKAKALGFRGAFRDYYDLYAISEKIGFKRMVDLILSFNKDFNLKLFFSQLLYTDDLENSLSDSLKGAYKITKEEITNHFKNSIEQWRLNG